MAAMATGITVRVRSQIGMWRFSGVDPTEPAGRLMQRIEAEKNIPIHQQSLSADPGGHSPIDPNTSLGSCGVAANGDVVHLLIDPNAAALVAGGPSMVTRKKIGPDGSIVAVEYEEAQKDRGFRPGMPRLRDMKKAWTLTDFLEMDEKFVYRFVKPAEGGEARKSSMCLGAHTHPGGMSDLATAMQSVLWSQCRVMYLYGTVLNPSKDGGSIGSKEGEGPEVVIEAMYEPPQDTSADGFTLLEDPREEQVARLAEMLGFTKVGWVFAHPPREDDFIMTANEIQMAGLQQLEHANGVGATPFVSLRVKPDEDGNAAVDAFQVTLQCMAMVAEGALEEDPKNRAASGIADTFTAIVEGKDGIKSVDNARFLLNAPVKMNAAPKLHVLFPSANRISSSAQSPEELKKAILDCSGSVTEALKDFNLLLYLMDFKEMLDWEHFMPRVCQAIITGVELDEGDKLIIGSIAGLD